MRAVLLLLLVAPLARAQSDRDDTSHASPQNLPIGGQITTQLRADRFETTAEAALGEHLRVIAGGAPGDSLIEGRAIVGLRLRLTTERKNGVATSVAVTWTAAGHELRPEVQVHFLAEKHVSAFDLIGEVTYAQELAEAQRDLELAAAAFRALTPRIQVGVAGHATIDLDQGRDDGGEVRWEAMAGPAASLRIGDAALLLHGGLQSLALPADTRSGLFALASLAAWF